MNIIMKEKVEYLNENEGRTKFHTGLFGYLWFIVIFFLLSVIFDIINFSDYTFPSAVIGGILMKICTIIGSYLMLRHQKLGFYLYVGSFLAGFIACFIAYGILDYHADLKLYRPLSPTESWLFSLLGSTFWIVVLLLFMLLKKKGKNAYHILWAK